MATGVKGDIRLSKARARKQSRTRVLGSIRAAVIFSIACPRCGQQYDKRAWPVVRGVIDGWIVSWMARPEAVKFGREM